MLNESGDKSRDNGAAVPISQVVAQLPRKERAALVAPYALNSVTMFYTRHGDWFALACAIISLAALVARFAFRKKAESPS